MEFEDILKNRRSHRAYLNTPVGHDLIEQLMNAAIKAPVSCNLQATQFVVVDDGKKLNELEQRVSYKFGYAPCCIVALYDPRVTIERLSIVSSTAMAVENILLKAVELGLATCPMAGFRKDEIIKQVLQIPSELEIAMIVSVGYPNTGVHKGDIPKVSAQDIYQYNSYQGLASFSLSPRLADHTPRSVADYRHRIAAVYLDRFRLHTWSEQYYQAIADHFIQQLPIEAKRVLDVLSYDGFFLKILHGMNVLSQHTFIASDYIPETLAFLQHALGVETVSISDENQIEYTSSIDIATFVLQAEFTPELEKILNSIHATLSKGGTLHISVIEESWQRRLRNWLKQIQKKYWQKKPVNIYENNPFYRIGPRRHVSKTELYSLLKRAGFSSVTDSVIKKYPRKGTVIRYYIAITS